MAALKSSQQLVGQQASALKHAPAVRASIVSRSNVASCFASAASLRAACGQPVLKANR